MTEPPIDPLPPVDTPQGGDSDLNQEIANANNHKGRRKPSPVGHDTWRDFCDTTSFHGLRYIGGRSPSGTVCRVIWVIIWLTMIGLCVWLCMNAVFMYLAFDVSSSVTIQIVERLDFPGITICNANKYRRRIVGSSWEFMKTMTTITSPTTRDDEQLKWLAEENWKYCNNTAKSNWTIPLETGEQYWQEKGFVQGMRPLTSDSYASIAKFWWNDTEFPIDGNFLNHAIDNTICFTFNPGRYYVDVVMNRTNVREVKRNFGYGLNAFNYRERKLLNAGPHNGLRLLLNVAQDDYCGITGKWIGAGFKAIIHEPNRQPWFEMEAAISLSPGFAYSIIVNPTLMYRKTADLGRCVYDFYLHMSPELHNSYYKSQCYQQCFYEMVFQRCHCLPPSAYRNQDIFGPVFIAGRTVNMSNICWDKGMLCSNQVKQFFQTRNIDQLCVCPEPCYETKYEYDISALLFPSDRLADYYAEVLQHNASELSINFLLVNFYFPSMSVKVIDEYQAFTMTGLFGYISAIVSLFLGSSVISIAEIFHQIRVSVFSKFK